MIFIIGTSLAFFFEFLLLGKKNKSLADKILAIWMFLIGLHLFLYYLWFSNLLFDFPHLMGIGEPFPFLHGPFLYLYTMALTGRLNKWKPIYWLHFSPVFLFYLYYLDFFFTFSTDEKIAFVKNIMEGNGNLIIQLLGPAILLSALTYHTLTLLLFRKHHRNIKNMFSYDDERVNLNWLRNLIIGMSAIWLAVILTFLNIEFVKDSDIIFVTVVIFVISIGYFGVRQGTIFSSVNEIKQDEKTNHEVTKRYSKSGLKKDKATKLKEQLIKLMTEEKLYLDESLSLPKLAKKLTIHPNYLSQIINEQFGKNFYDFVNEFRVDEFKRLLIKPANRKMTFFALAIDSGFASKASFNKAFKKFTGQTPSEYSNHMQSTVN